ncbi:hypothetical protein GCM10010402_20620 [Actinomadura luteofluorescens]
MAVWQGSTAPTGCSACWSTSSPPTAAGPRPVTASASGTVTTDANGKPLIDQIDTGPRLPFPVLVMSQ